MTKFGLKLKIVIFWIYLYAVKELDCRNIPKATEFFDEDAYSCNIISDGIECYSNSESELINEIKRLSNNLTEDQKHFNRFNLFYSPIETIPENVFYDISFDQILIYQMQNLTSIHSKAFIGSEDSIKRLSILGTNRLRNVPSSEYDLYEAISSLKNLEYLGIELEEDSEHEIPDNAFHAVEGTQNNLESVYYYGRYNITRIGDYVFADSPLLRQFIVTGIPINTISGHAFDSRSSIVQPLSVTLSGCSLTETSFESAIFRDLKRPLYLYLSDNQIQYINQDTFGDFFSNEDNLLDLMGNDLECDHIEQFQWLFDRGEQLEDRITNAVCKDGTPFWDLSNSTTGSTLPSTITPETTTGNFASNLSFSLIFVLSIGFIQFITVS